MKEAPKYEELKDEVVRLKERIAYLERLLFGAKSDKLRITASANEPGLFDEWFKEAMDEKPSKIEKAKAEIEKEAETRRSKPRKKAGRPSKYQYHGFEERVTVIMPEGVEAASCDIIGKDVSLVLHYEAAKVWVEVVERPILRPKADKSAPHPRIFQAAANNVLKGGHVAEDMLSQIIVNKYRYHLPEYRQVRQ